MPLLLIDLETEEGVTGRSYLFCYLRAAQPAIAGFDVACWDAAPPSPPGSR